MRKRDERKFASAKRNHCDSINTHRNSKLTNAAELACAYKGSYSLRPVRKNEMRASNKCAKAKLPTAYSKAICCSCSCTYKHQKSHTRNHASTHVGARVVLKPATVIRALASKLATLHSTVETKLQHARCHIHKATSYTQSHLKGRR